MRYPAEARIVALCSAIAHAEGFWVPGARPRRDNNPGDLVGDGAIDHQFPSRVAGFDALAFKVSRILAGESLTYPTLSTWQTFADTWTGGDNAGAWCAAVCEDLSVNPASTLADWIQSTGSAPLPE